MLTLSNVGAAGAALAEAEAEEPVLFTMAQPDNCKTAKARKVRVASLGVFIGK